MGRVLVVVQRGRVDPAAADPRPQRLGRAGQQRVQFGGAPFAADPQSGWTYLPAMVLFTALPVSAAKFFALCSKGG